ncbi:MAG: phospholipase D-like domain-containing protein [Elusimicrobiota bacterium]
MFRPFALALAFAPFVWTAAFGGPIEVYFAPDGGFSPGNNERALTLPDGREVKATLANALQDMIERTEDGGAIKLCMYAMGTMDTMDALIRAAADRDVAVKLILDAGAEWSADSRKALIERVAVARRKAKRDGLPFDFQIKLITKTAMEDRGRVRELANGKIIHGTMHEKFGVFYGPESKVPYESFAGSANVSEGSDQVYAENRIFFRDRPAVARQFQEEFARLWNEYGTCAQERCASEMYVPADPVSGGVRVIFNGEPLTEDRLYRIDEELERLIKAVGWRGGSVDLAMFSFTHRELADTLVRYAQMRKGARFRILLDQSMLAVTEGRIGLMGPWLEERIRIEGLKNMEVRYKWRSTAYGFDEEAGEAALSHYRSLLLHHKLMIVNKDVLATGSYNWSESAEERNFENLMVFERAYKGHADVIDRFLAEYDSIWAALKAEGPVPEPVTGGPQVVTGPQGRALRKDILELLADEKNRGIMESLYKGKFRTAEQLGGIAGASGEDLQARLDAMVRATLLCRHVKDGVEGYSAAD